MSSAIPGCRGCTEHDDLGTKNLGRARGESGTWATTVRATSSTSATTLVRLSELDRSSARRAPRAQTREKPPSTTTVVPAAERERADVSLGALCVDERDRGEIGRTCEAARVARKQDSRALELLDATNTAERCRLLPGPCERRLALEQVGDLGRLQGARVSFRVERTREEKRERWDAPS